MRTCGAPRKSTGRRLATSARPGAGMRPSSGYHAGDPPCAHVAELRGSGLDLYSAAVAAQRVAGPTDTRHVAIYFPHTNLCGWAGMASVGGGMVWLNGPVNADVLAHETGHNFGLGHANTYTCSSGGARVALVIPLTGCTATPYGDYADVMGIAMTGRPTGSLNTALADQLGLAQVTDLAGQATGVATIDLAALGVVGAGRGLVAMGFLLSSENLGTVVNDQYLNLLGRGIDPTGRQGWVAAIQGGHRLEEVIGGIIASAEYYNEYRPS